MSQQALSSQRFGRNPRNQRKVNRFFQYNNKVHDVPVALQQRETNIVNVALGGQVQIEPSLVDMAENFVLKCTISLDSGSVPTNWGLDLISSISLRSGANVLQEYNPAKVWYRYILDKAPKELRDRAKEIFFQGLVIYLPLPYPGVKFLYDNWSRPQETPFPMGGLNSKRPITWDIKFNTAAGLSANQVNLTLDNVVLQYDEIIMENPSRVRKPFSVSCQDLKIFPSTVALAAGVEVEVPGLESIGGAVSGYYIYNQVNTNTQAGDDQSITEKIDESEILLDGRSLMKFTDQKHLQATHVLRGWNIADSDGTGQNYLFLSGYPSESMKHAYLHTSGAKRISMKLKTANASTAVISAITHRTFFSDGNVVKVREQ